MSKDLEMGRLFLVTWVIQCYLKSPSQREARGLESDKGDVKVQTEIKLMFFEVGEWDYESRNVGVLYKLDKTRK